MSSFNNNGVTLKGAVIIASLVAGDTLTFTRISVGDGVLPSGQTVLTTEKLVNPLFDVPISSVESDSVAHATVKGIFSNADLDTGFYYRELGLFAINPVTKAEELFCYGNAGDEAEWINAVGESSLVEKEIHLVTLIGNATTVTANLDPKAPALKSEMDAILPLKADLDAPPENGGRVLASQMRFLTGQTFYVDASAAAGGDGTINKPFKTIQAAVSARYRGCNHIEIFIAPGDYNEAVTVGSAAGTAWTFSRNGNDAVKLKSITVGACDYVAIINLTFNATGSESSLTLTNVANAYLNSNIFNGSGTNNAININLSRAMLVANAINNAYVAINVGNNSVVNVISTSGTGNAVGINTEASLITGVGNTMAATTKYIRANGANIMMEGGDSSFPSNYSQLYHLGNFGNSDAIKAAILSEFRALKLNESRICSFGTDVPFGPFIYNQRIRCDITKLNTENNGSGVVTFYSFHPTATTAIMQIANGTLSTEEPVALVAETMVATPAAYGVVRVAATVEDELDSTCEDAALTPANIHAMANYRIANKAYVVGDIVAVPYHAEFFMECIVAGTTSTTTLDTTSVAIGDTFADGGVTWVVIPSGAIYRVYGEVTDRDTNKPTYGLG